MEREPTRGEYVRVHGLVVGTARRGYAISVASGVVLDLARIEFEMTEEKTMGHELLRYFKYDHLPEDLQVVSRPFYHQAAGLSAMRVIDEAERDVALRKLLEAKDAAVRSVVT